MRADQGLSDIVGTAALLAVTVVVAGSAVLALTSSGGGDASPGRIDLLANATASDPGQVTLRHAGGAALPREAVGVVVSSSSWPASVRAGVDGAWDEFELGRAGRVGGLPALAAGDRVEVLLYAGGGSDLVATATFVVAASAPPAAPPLDGFEVDVVAPLPGAAVLAGGMAYFEVEAAHPHGRKAISHVVVDLTALSGPSAFALRDDGTLGDATAGDGTFSAFVPIPAHSPLGARAVRVDAYDLDARRDDQAGADPSTWVAVLAPAAGEGADGLGGVDGLPGAAGVDGEVVLLAGPQGAPGASGTSAAAGGDGSDGSGGSDGEDAVSGDDEPLPPLSIGSVSPGSGGPGTLVRLDGTGLLDVAGVTLARVGESVGYTATYAPDPTAPLGTIILFSVPSIAPGDHVVTLTRRDGAWATAPTLFAVSAPQPTIDAIEPPQARAYAQVLVLGSDLSSVTSVTLHDAAGATVAVPWSIVDDEHLGFVTHPGLAPGRYDVNVSTGTRWAVAPLAFEALPPLGPSGLTLSPASAAVDDTVRIQGVDLGTVTRIVLSSVNESRTIEPGWYLDGDEIVMVVPAEAAPDGAWSLEYAVDLSGTFDGIVTVPDRLTVTPTPPPILTSFTPKQGEPFTQVNIFGANFVNVRSVAMGDASVYFATVSSHQILAVTHGGLGTGNYTINVTTATGYAVSSATFEALPLKLTPVYDESLFSYVGADLTADRGSNNDPITTRLKFQLVDPRWTVAGVTYNPVNFEPQSGSTPYLAMSRVCGPVAGVHLWSLGWTSLHAYLSPANELDFVYGVLVDKGDGSRLQTYIFTNDETRNFILPAGQYRMTVLDHGIPTTGFTDCS